MREEVMIKGLRRACHALNGCKWALGPQVGPASNLRLRGQIVFALEYHQPSTTRNAFKKNKIDSKQEENKR
jgi:hypothetical protein